MTTVEEEGITIAKKTKGFYDYSNILDISKFSQPAECSISEEDKIYNEKIFLEYKYQKYRPYIRENEKTKIIEEIHELSQPNIMDICNISPAEIIIEDEIKKGYFWFEFII